MLVAVGCRVGMQSCCSILRRGVAIHELIRDSSNIECIAMILNEKSIHGTVSHTLLLSFLGQIYFETFSDISPHSIMEGFSSNT